MCTIYSNIYAYKAYHIREQERSNSAKACRSNRAALRQQLGKWLYTTRKRVSSVAEPCSRNEIEANPSGVRE